MNNKGPCCSVCPKCGKREAHFVPPSFGDDGFFTCEAEKETPAPEFEPCDVCGGTEADFDGFCSHCEIPMEIKKSAAQKPARRERKDK
jgi:hypothetical protein